MTDTPIRHTLLLAVLLFVILSSGSLQCALNCYDRVDQYSTDTAFTTDCHPLALEEVAANPVSSFCHLSHSSRQLQREPVLNKITSGQILALSCNRTELPEYRSAEPVDQTYSVIPAPELPLLAQLPRSQSRKELRSTILLM